MKGLVISSICAVALAETSLPQDIEKAICMVATQKDIEDKEVAKVCKVIEEKFPAIKFQPDCPTIAASIWDAAAAHCPKPKKDLTEKGIPSIKDLEKLVCELASKKQIEDRASGEVCKLIVKKFPAVPEEVCVAAVDKLWDTIVKKCPKPVAAAAPIDDIEKLLCKIASQKEIEDRETTKVCALIAEKAPFFHFKPDCHTVVEGVWDSVIAKCPKMQKATDPAPKDIEKVICELLSQKEIEDKEVAKVCALFKEKIPFFHFEPSCPAAMDAVWDSVIAHCPKTANKVIVV